MNSKVYDIIGIGIGPFNLGMAALCDSIPELDCLFIDQEKSFSWHPGMMLPNTHLQVPFYADLVTLADPQNRFSFLAYLKAKKRLFRFAIYENNFVSRMEYNDYCKWVASQLDCLRFGQRCEAIHYNPIEKVFEVFTKETTGSGIVKYVGKHIVLGIGTTAKIPACAEQINHAGVFHSGKYLFNKELLLSKKSVTIVGSGQSAAEIFYDLLPHSKQFENGLNWFTRSDRFFPMEYSKLSLEMTSPDYIEHFFGLQENKKRATLSKQNMLYKGINFELINRIYDELYQQQFENISKIGLFTNCELKVLKQCDNKLLLQFEHNEAEQEFKHCTDTLILATGYGYQVPSFIDPVRELIQWTEDKKFKVNLDYSISADHKNIFVQNADLHTHGFNSPDLGMGPYRNAVILNTILGKEKYCLEKNIAFQTFGVPKS